MGNNCIITNYEISYLPLITNYSSNDYNTFKKEIFNKAKNIAILKYLKNNNFI